MHTTELIELRLNNVIEAGDKARGEFAAAVTTQPLRTLWSQAGNATAMELGDMASDFKEGPLWDSTSDDLQEAIERAVKRLRKLLLGGHFDGSSTSALSNAFDDSRRDAARRFLDLLEIFAGIDEGF